MFHISEVIEGGRGIISVMKHCYVIYFFSNIITQTIIIFNTFSVPFPVNTGNLVRSLDSENANTINNIKFAWKYESTCRQSFGMAMRIKVQEMLSHSNMGTTYLGRQSAI